MGRRQREALESRWIPTANWARGAVLPFDDTLKHSLKHGDVERFGELRCGKVYAKKMGGAALAPALYVRLLLIGYFEGIESERRMDWRVPDAIALRRFLGYAPPDPTPDHSTIRRKRRLIDVDTHNQVVVWVLELLTEKKLLDGKTLGVDATTLEANAALRSIVRKDTGESYRAFLIELDKASGIETPTLEDLVRIDKDRKYKGANDDGKHPHDPDAKITKRKEGRTHLAHKGEHAGDLTTGAIVGVTLQPDKRGDVSSSDETVSQADANLAAVIKSEKTGTQLHESVLSEVVADKGYHSNAVLKDYRESEIRTYISEPDRGRRNWKDKPAERDAVYANRRRIRGERGRGLMRKRGELIERSFAHCYDTGRMRRTHLRGHSNILKRLLIHVAGFNLSLLLRQVLGIGTPRGLQGLSAAVLALRRTRHACLAGLRAITTAPRHCPAYSDTQFQIAA